VLLNRWNETRQEHPDALIHELFERACEKTPAALAVESAEASMSYAELNGAANMLAHRLRAMVRLE
jgi:non-ribosomal peptide synthetase component F